MSFRLPRWWQMCPRIPQNFPQTSSRASDPKLWINSHLSILKNFKTISHPKGLSSGHTIPHTHAKFAFFQSTVVSSHRLLIASRLDVHTFCNSHSKRFEVKCFQKVSFRRFQSSVEIPEVNKHLKRKKLHYRWVLAVSPFWLPLYLSS